MSNFLDLAQTLQMAIKALQMYTGAHPRSQSALRSLAELLGQWLADSPSIHIAASGNKVFLDGNPVEGQSLHLTALCRQLSERQISGFIIQRGVTPEELKAVLDILILKPSKIEEQGGVAAIMDRLALGHVQLGQTQYRAVREGEGGEDEAKGPAMTARAEEPVQALEQALLAPSAAPSAILQEVAAMLQQWKNNLESAVGEAPILGPDGEAFGPFADWTPPFPGALPPADLSSLGHVAKGLGWGESFPTAAQMEALRQALHGLDGTAQLSILAGMNTLPTAPGGLRMGFQSLAPEIFAQATGRLLDQDVSWANLRDALFDILRYSPQKQAMAATLEAFLRARGMDDARIAELMHQLDWEGQTLEAKIQRAMEDRQLWELSLEQRLAFIRELLDDGRVEPLLNILDQILEALTVEDALLREAAAQTLAGITHWMLDPGLPVEAEGPIIQGLTAHFGWEPLPHIHRATTEALEPVLACFVSRGEVAQAQGLVQELMDLCAFMEEKQEWRDQALTRLRERLGQRDLLDGALNALHAAEPEAVLATMIPYFEFIGEPAARHLVAILGDEPERKRRGRLLDVIRVMGDLAIPSLRDGLASPTWYVVRNTLNLLADMGDADLLTTVTPSLRHADGRVRRAAVRAAWKLGGPPSEPYLLGLLHETDPDTQIEIFFGLGQVQSREAVPTLAEFAQDRRFHARERIKALDTLGQIGDPKAIPALVELARRKGRIFTSAEPTDIRLGAARALLSIGTPEAVAALKKLVDAEPRRNRDREALQRILELHGSD